MSLLYTSLKIKRHVSTAAAFENSEIFYMEICRVIGASIFMIENEM